MSRLHEIIDNHQNLDQLFAIMKHYGVNAEFISSALVTQFEETMEQNSDDSEETATYSQALVDDLKQFNARF
ncbi:hypothetical protein D3P08_21000 [Paenibacillus nanensis]|uniref:Uncharacterized protein n=1 Tax=Paenibacillus nanensis TaxID=393251 RepID=A0A3A1UPZ7_9BACL|nr:hypothetical protein [Paenibacillus nanensis]RIX50325.1 hypothetical protein D3P08_21000 [Paenibacillus nanensis]